MKKIILAFVMICFLPVTVTAADFIFDRGVFWGMTQKQLLKIEKGNKVKSKSADKVVIRTEYRQFKDVDISYGFVNKELATAEFTLNYATTVSNANIYYRDYQELVSQLSEAYGKPDEEGFIWILNDNSLKSSYQEQDKYGLAVSLGHLEAEAVWEIEAKNMVIVVHLFSPASLKAAINVRYQQL